MCITPEDMERIEGDLRRHEEMLVAVHRKLDDLGEVAEYFRNAKNAGTFVSSLIMGTAKMSVSVGAILAAIYALKEWIKK